MGHPPKMCVRTLLLCLALLTSSTLRAQMDVQFSDFTRLRSYYNPAVSGTDGLLNVAAAYAMQFAGYDNAPATMYVGADLPIYFLNAHHGAGVNFMNDVAGMFTQTHIGLQYAYNFNVSSRSKVAIGVQAGIITEKIDPSKVKLEDQSDPAFPSSQVSGNRVDFSAGAFYYHPRYWAGVAVQHLSAPLIEMETRYQYQIDRMYNLMGGCNIPLKNSFLSLEPAFMVMTDMQNWREDVQLKVHYNYQGRSFYAGLGYSPDISTTVFVGGNFHGVTLGYSYQMYTSGVGMANGSHEITLGYQTELDLFKKGKNRHKSVRFL